MHSGLRLKEPDFPSSGTFVSSIKDSCRIVTMAANIKVSFAFLSSTFSFVFVFRFNPPSISAVVLITHGFLSVNSL
jgi:hypothetical protein